MTDGYLIVVDTVVLLDDALYAGGIAGFLLKGYMLWVEDEG